MVSEGYYNNYGQNGEITADGVYDIYFRPNGDGGDDWFYFCIYVTPHVESGTCGENLTWMLENNGTLTISGTGDMTNYSSSSSAPWNSSSSSIKAVVIDDGVTSIGNNAFSDCSSITNIAIPKNVTSIGNSAFDACVNLTDVYYCGTSEDWVGILMGTDNDCLASAKRHYMPSGSGGAGQDKFSAVLNKIGSNLIVTANVPDMDIAKNVHAAMYSGSGKMLDYMIYPAEFSNNTVHFMFRELADLSYIKVFLWSGLENMMPLAESIILNVAE